MVQSRRGRDSALIVAAGVSAVVLAVAARLVPRLVARRDERRPGAPEPPRPLASCVETTVLTDDGASLHVVDCGTGPTILFVHGLSLDSRSWYHQFDDLADRFRVVAVDLRGHGRSTVGTTGIGPGRFAADLATVIEQLELRDVVLVGHSIGGTVVGQLCVDNPQLVRERVAGLVFVGTFAAAVAGEGLFRERVSPTLVRASARMRVRDTTSARVVSSGMGYLVARSTFGPRPHAVTVRFIQQLSAGVAPSVIAAAAVGNLSYDARAALAELDVPSLVIRGAHDPLATRRSVAQLQSALRDAETVVFDDCGHAPMLEDHVRFDEVLAAFAERAVAAPR